MKIKIADLDLSLQTRCGTDAETIDNYAQAMADGAAFPDVTVFTDGERYWLADGFHRVMAAKQNGKTSIAADVRKGTEDDAVVFGGTANNKQGKRPTRADVQHFLTMVWERREAIFGGTPTGGNLAEKCGVSRSAGEAFVRARLAEMPSAPIRPTARNTQLKAPERPERLVGANGRTYPVRPTVEPTAPVRPTAQVAQLKALESPSRPAPQKPPKPKIAVDRFGVEIPLEINAAFEGGILSDVASLISKARVALRKGMDDGLPEFAAVRQDALVMLNNAYNFTTAAEPHCVCRMCQGIGCRACHGRGWQTEEEYNRNPEEFRA